MYSTEIKHGTIVIENENAGLRISEKRMTDLFYVKVPTQPSLLSRAMTTYNDLFAFVILLKH